MLVPALFVADSVRAHSSKKFDIVVFCEPCEVTQLHRDWMRKRAIVLCDTMDVSGQRGIVSFSGRLTEATLMKLGIARHMAGRYDKLLYLDCDLTIHGDVGALFSLDMCARALAAVPAGGVPSGQSPDQSEAAAHLRALGMTEPYRYFNAGVLLIDVESWNRQAIGERALAFVRENPELCRLADEDSLNAVLDGDVLDLSPVWNVHPSYVPRGRRGAFLDPVILHHFGDDKPWRRYGYRKRLFPDRSAYRAYEAFLKTTPWPGWLGEQWKARDLLANVQWEIRRLTRRIRGKSDEPTAAEHRRRVEGFRRYCARTWFADVEQGLVVRVNGSLRVNRQAA
jgi:lipopolysaccharide biosynthesis glycosyltransferase